MLIITGRPPKEEKRLFFSSHSKFTPALLQKPNNKKATKHNRLPNTGRKTNFYEAASSLQAPAESDIFNPPEEREHAPLLSAPLP